MKMKKILSLCFLMFVLSNGVFSQNWKLNYGGSIGVTNSNYILENISSGVGRSASSTVNGQLTGWVTLSPNAYFGLETGASIVGLGAKLNQSEFGNREILQHTYWLQVPFNFVGKLPLRDSSEFFLKAGGYVGLGIAGKNTIPDSYTGSARREFSFDKDGTQKGLDVGWSIGLGYKLKSGYLIHLGYQRGLFNLAPTAASYEQRNRAYTIGIGYEF